MPVSKTQLSNILPIHAVETHNIYDLVIENLDPQLSHENQNKLVNLLEEIENMTVEKIEDNYNVRVHLKDASLFRYSPRRMSFAEKKTLDEITDDLLERGIIKISISPYCSRVVLVTRSNGKARMCIDLRPLNQRIYPQKFPFPIIEDLLDQLHGKALFTKLDLRDGFH